MSRFPRGGPESTLDASVIIPLQDTRGWVDACMRGWSEGQTHPRDRYEIIVVSDGSERESERSAVRWLRPHDSLVRRGNTENEFEQFNVGEAAARGRFLLFTEMHCCPEPRCLAALLERLVAGDVVGAHCRSLGVASSRIGRLEQKVFEEAIEAAESPGDWRKVLIHGFIVESEVFRKWGGFEHRYGDFAGLLLAARLDAAGVALGFAPDAVVRHHYTGDLRELYRYVESYATGELKFLRSSGGDRWARYFGRPPELRRFGTRRRLEARLRRAWHRCQLAIWSHSPHRRESAYRAWWSDIIHSSRLAEMARSGRAGPR